MWRRWQALESVAVLRDERITAICFSRSLWKCHLMIFLDSAFPSLFSSSLLLMGGNERLRGKIAETGKSENVQGKWHMRPRYFITCVKSMTHLSRMHAILCGGKKSTEQFGSFWRVNQFKSRVWKSIHKGFAHWQKLYAHDRVRRKKKVRGCERGTGLEWCQKTFCSKELRGMLNYFILTMCRVYIMIFCLWEVWSFEVQIFLRHAALRWKVNSGKNNV